MLDAHIREHGYRCPGRGPEPAWHEADPETNPLTADHVRPASRGGADGELRPLCRSCNSSKGSG